ncbi:ABC transporter permease [Paenarthrobacter nitroguajacolicus]|uniref:ABC transporter permease n=1 Tax=Paenarthrobacter nitroguajacolicus TaxID=211146 RepID=UPI00248C641D|nr:polyketide antibiotic transporter [Paenarthrobacter nitroguajacolicus]MDI2035750.1 Multidrug efflux system permease protein [Paenarthrobacter nitroguajacolicus]
MTGVMGLLLTQTRRERILLPVWIVGIAFLGFIIANAVSTEFGDETARAAIITVASASPAFLFVRGLTDGTGIGAVVFFQGYTFTAVLAGLMSTFLVIRHTRTDEELGRAELIGSVPLRRAAPLAATLILGGVANLVLALAIAAGFVAAGLPSAGALTAGAAVGSVGAFFVATTAVLAQIMPSGRSANGVAAGLVGAAYFVRGIGDAFGTPSADLTHVTSGWFSWFSPIGWGQRSRPFSDADPVPLVGLAVLSVVLGAVVVVLRSRRDLGESLLPERSGRDRAAVVGGSSLLGLAWRQQRLTLLGWCVFAALLGSIAGGLGPVVTNVIGGNESLRELILRLVPGGRGGLIDVFTTALLGIGGVIAAAAGIQAVLRLRAEEAEGRAELLLATPRSSARWLGASLVIATVSALAIAVVAGCAATLGLSLSGVSSGTPGLLVGAALAHVPAAVVFVAFTALAFATIPRLSIAVGWGFLAVGLVLGQFGELMHLPAWLQDLSPFRHTAAMPVEAFDPGAALTMTAIALAGAGIAGYLLRRRDLTA